ncbi:single-stranded DNA-binding protein [bacterium]|nr:single-stranded DNA-binding protein [bacterium]
MTLAKAAVTGIVYREPKTGYTQNNVAVSSFVMNIGEGGEETLVRVISKRQALSDVIETLSKNQKVLVGGRLQTGVSKLDDGTEKKVFEIEASSIELMGGSSAGSEVHQDGDILSFGDMDSSNTSETEVLMDDGEIPF